RLQVSGRKQLVGRSDLERLTARRVRRRLGARPQIELGQDPTYVVSRSPRTDEQLIRNLGVRQPTLQQCKDLALPLREQANLTWPRPRGDAKAAELRSSAAAAAASRCAPSRSRRSRAQLAST